MISIFVSGRIMIFNNIPCSLRFNSSQLAMGQSPTVRLPNGAKERLVALESIAGSSYPYPVRTRSLGPRAEAQLIQRSANVARRSVVVTPTAVVQ